MRRTLSARLGLILAAAAMLPAAAHASDEGRFAVRGQVQVVGQSEDHRFALRAELRQTPSTASADGRFVLKAANAPEAACDPSVDLFANGFEGS